MRATSFEFRHRLGLLAAVFVAAFSAYAIDPTNVVAGVARVVDPNPSPSPSGADARSLVSVVLWAGAALAALGAALWTWAVGYLSSDVVHSTEVQTGTLVAAGPYRHVRNPLYLGLLAIAVAFALAASRLGCAIALVGTTIVVLRLIGREESELWRTQGEPFAAYCRAVPRLMPAWRPRVPASGQRPRWGQAFAGEVISWGCAAGAVAMALTGDARILGAVCAASFVPGVLLAARARRARADSPPPIRG